VSEQTQGVDEYLGNLTAERKSALTELRELILATVPQAEESVRYRMPTYEYADEVLCAFASQKHYMSLYMDTELVDRHRHKLRELDVGKSCIRFRKLDRLPLDTIRTILLETVAKREIL
jgi:uncharacterized protein YdhG (YjbR/CyaY superfamily)